VALAAVRTPSAERRRDLADLLNFGLSREDAELVGIQALLKLLEQLNDPQVLILMFYGSFSRSYGNPERDAFWRKHSEVLDASAPSLGDHDEAATRRWSLNQHYQNSMVTLGVLKDIEGIAKSPIPELQITKLGYMLLEAIGRPVVPS